MPIIQDKILLQAQNPSKVFLYKEGLFYKGYNQRTYLMRDTKHKVNIKKLKNIQIEVLSIGFPESVYNKLHEKLCVQTFESYSCFNCDIVYNEEEFQILFNKGEQYK